MSDMQKVRDAIEAAGLYSVGGSGPMYNDKRADGTRRIKLTQGGYMPLLPMAMQWLVYDYLRLFFGERLVKVYLKKNSFGGFFNPYNTGRTENQFSLCVVVKDIA